MRFPFKERRLVNHFMVGADPEFVFTAADNLSSYHHASQFLEAGGNGPFGADGSGRQAELRAWPSRSVLEVVASLSEALQGLYCCVAAVRGYRWLAPAIHGTDGCGGHVHFGRKRPGREQEVLALDRMSKSLLLSGLLDFHGQGLRVCQTGYGKMGDWREQRYGYEYRTLPTWLNTPHQAFLSMTALKLAVLETAKLGNAGFLEFPTIAQMFKAFAGRDNDAAIAYQMMQWMKEPPPKMDMRTSWHVDPTLHGVSTRQPPSPETVAELGEALWEGRPFGGSRRKAEPLADLPPQFDIRDYSPSYETVISERFWWRVNELWRHSWARAMTQTLRKWTVNAHVPWDIAYGTITPRAFTLLPPVRRRHQMRLWTRAFLSPIKFELLGVDYVRNSGNQAV